jgi:hypothetical protein
VNSFMFEASSRRRPAARANSTLLVVASITIAPPLAPRIVRASRLRSAAPATEVWARATALFATGVA